METSQEILGYKIHSDSIMDGYVKDIASKAISFIDLHNELESVCKILKITWDECALSPNEHNLIRSKYGKLSFTVKILRIDLFHIVLMELDRFFNRCFDTTITIKDVYIYIDIIVSLPNNMLNDDFFINKVLNRYKQNIFRMRIINKIHKFLYKCTSDII